MANEEMVLETQHGEQLYNVSTMADGARNTGYKSTYNAIAEIVDIKHVLKNKKLLVRFLPGDIINGATDLDLYEYCKANGWELYIRFDLHAKTYIFDKKRYILGSGNLTSRGLGLNCLGNYELADFSQIEGDDLFKIESLFSSAILMTDELYSLMKMDIVKFPKVSVNEAKALNWDKYISDKFEPDTSVLFTYDFPQVPAPSSEIDEYEFLELSGISDKEKIKQAFRWSKAFTWLCKTINEKDIRECYFGELSAKLHNALINDPKPYGNKLKVPNFPMSEAAFLIWSLDQREDWATIICLVGGGQEINTGEAGISEWINALNEKFPHWNVYISSKLTEAEYAEGKINELLEKNDKVTYSDHLHLAVSLRSYRAEKLSAFVHALLAIEPTAAELYNEIKDKW